MVSTNGTGVASPQEKRLQQRREARQAAHQDRQRHDRVLNEFQPDAVEIERQPVSGGARWTLYAVISLLMATVAWAYWAHVDQVVVAEGKLITSVSPIMVDTKLPSPIKSILVKFGDRVTAGQVVATLDPTISEADLKLLELKHDLLVAQRARLTAEKNGVPFSLAGREDDRDWLVQEQLYRDRKGAYDAKIREFDAEESKLVVIQKNNEDSIEFHKENLVDLREYEEKIIRLVEKKSKTEEDRLSRKMQTNEAKMKWREVISKSDELVKELEALQTRRQAYISDERAKVMVDLVATHEKLVETEQQLQKAFQSNSYVNVTVPESLPYKEFVVIEVSEQSVGTISEPGKPLLKLIPIDVPLEAEIEVPGRDIGRIKVASASQLAGLQGSGDTHEVLPPGSVVRVKLASFPFQKHGTLRGVVKTISEDSFEKEEARGIPSMTTYKVRVQLLEPIQLEKVGPGFRLMPGMATTAEIKVGNQRVINYFLYPLLRYLDQSIREP